MYIADKLLYVDLHKTGCTHIRRLLDEYIGGKKQGKHNRFPMFDRDAFVVGSIRNPWDWYVSLFGYGCSGKGALYRRMTKRFDFYYYTEGMRKEMVADSLSLAGVASALARDFVKPVSRYTELYSDPDNVRNFRAWLKALYSAESKLDVGEGYAYSRVSEITGLYTYRFLKLYIWDVKDLFNGKTLNDQEAVRRFEKENNASQFMIRTENLEADFIEMLRAAGIAVREETKAKILQEANNKTNSSKHLPTHEYYDDETASLVAEKESLIIEKFGYSFPS